MVLTFANNPENIPENVKILSRNEALAHQVKLIRKWEKPSEVFFLKYGSVIAGLVTSIASLPIIHHFRKQFKLNRYGLFVTYVPASLMPALGTAYGHDKLVTSEILLMKMQCPLCMQFKYAAYHLCTSIFYTTALTAITCSSVAFSRRTRYVPAPQSEGKLYIKLFWDMTKAGARRYQAITIFQLVAVLFLPYIQVQQFSDLIESLSKKEEMILNSQDSISSDEFA